MQNMRALYTHPSVNEEPLDNPWMVPGIQESEKEWSLGLKRTIYVKTHGQEGKK